LVYLTDRRLRRSAVVFATPPGHIATGFVCWRALRPIDLIDRFVDGRTLMVQFQRHGCEQARYWSIKMGAMAVRTLTFIILRQVLSLVGLGPSSDAKDVEIAMLRHQLMAPRRQVARPRYTRSERTILAASAKLLPRDRWPIFLVTPSTLERWHRGLLRRRWTYSTNGRHRGLDPEVVDLVLQLARENPRWGCLRIVGECR
jgi:hypothetical protein